VSRRPEKLDLALTTRLREVVTGQPTTESELRTLADQAGGWERATEAQLRAAETRLAKLNADAASPLAEMATEIRRVEALTEELEEARLLVHGLERRTRELRTAFLKHHAESARPFTPPPG
jgi:type VI protein secretion system component VasF